MPSIAERLIELRENNKLNQVQVSKLLNVTPALISAYEKNERKPSLEKLVQLADIYHTSTDYILGRHSSSSDQRIYIEATGLSDKQLAILRELIIEMKR